MIRVAVFFIAWLHPFVGDSFAARKNPRPNVLFLVVDDMNDWVNCLGGYNGKTSTPHIDRLAKRGVLFTNAHCPSPKCAPSRAAVLTGMRPSTTGLYENSHWWLPNLPDVVTIPMRFRQEGYHVVGAGKIFHHTAGNHPPNQWDDFQRLTFRADPWFRGVLINYPWSKPSPYPVGFPFSGVNGLGHENDWGVLPIDDDEYDDAATARYAIRFLETYSDRLERPESKPFFLACGFFRPHLPWYVPQAFFDQIPFDDVVLPHVPDDDLEDVPAEGRRLAAARRQDLETIQRSGKWKHAVRAYLASTACVDQRIGKVLDALDRSGHVDNTIIVLWSDHGWHLGEKHHWHKTMLWEEATRVPLVLIAPGFQPGVCHRPVSLLDLFPTLNDLAGFPAEGPYDGVSLTPLMRAPDALWKRPAVIEYKRGNAAVRSEHYRYILYRDGGEELYDHRVDPDEWNNLIDQPGSRAVADRLSRWITKDWAPACATKPAFEFDPESFTWTHLETGLVTLGIEP
ncbi:MAG: sulfatase [Planctomycetota bacterium]